MLAFRAFKVNEAYGIIPNRIEADYDKADTEWNQANKNHETFLDWSGFRFDTCIRPGSYIAGA